ncbi:MAG: hypothetical protein ACJASQ_004072 [Crocinitomicaceae bacterium]|jgi:hypothetical protein
MRKLILLSFLFIGGLAVAQSTENAGLYMNYFSAESDIIQKDMWDYTRSVSHGKSARKVEKRRAELIASSNTALGKARRAKDFEGDASYKDAVVNFLNIVNIVLKEDYAKIVDMEEVSEQSYDAMEAYMMARELANDKQAEAGNDLSAAQKVFADAHDIEIVASDDPMNEKMEIAGKVYDHYNEVFLIFFKSNKQEIYLIDAMGSKDLSAIEQNKEALTSTTEEGFGKLKEVNPYKGDNTMVDATEALFKFYEKEVEDTQLAVDYFLKSENFMKIKEGFDQIKEKNRTQENVDEFNNAVIEMNAAVEAYNKENEINNKTRGRLIDDWNAAADKFTNKHVPKGK